MDLDTTILQSNTAKELIEYTNKLIKVIDKSKLSYAMQEDYKDITLKFNKAWKRRTKGYR